MAVSDMEALEILDLLAGVGARPWVAGSWGVDALVERQTRVHRGLDLMVRADRLDACVDALRGKGFRESADALPVRLELDDGVRVVDLHPVHDDPDQAGATWQAAPAGRRWHYPTGSWVGGLLGGRTVVCASPELALRRLGGNVERPRPEDEHDLHLLRALLDDRMAEPGRPAYPSTP